MRTTHNPRADAFLKDYADLCQRYGLMIYTIGGGPPNRIGLLYDAAKFHDQGYYVDSTVTTPAQKSAETQGGGRAGASVGVNVIIPEKDHG